MSGKVNFNELGEHISQMVSEVKECLQVVQEDPNGFSAELLPKLAGSLPELASLAKEIFEDLSNLVFHLQEEDNPHQNHLQNELRQSAVLLSSTDDEVVARDSSVNPKEALIKTKEKIKELVAKCHLYKQEKGAQVS